MGFFHTHSFARFLIFFLFLNSVLLSREQSFHGFDELLYLLLGARE